MLRNVYNIAVWVVACMMVTMVSGQQTERIYLSGTGSDDMVDWDFYCTAGMNAGKWTTIGVPSCWELQGFGHYDYGFAPDSVRGKENGHYKRRFPVPQHWRGKKINIVLEGVMTDAEGRIKGKVAGQVHQTCFKSIRSDLSGPLKYGA